MDADASEVDLTFAFIVVATTPRCDRYQPLSMFKQARVRKLSRLQAPSE
jgi:hypothetical protein